MEVAISAAMCSMVKPGGSAGNVDSGSASGTGGGVGLDWATVGGCDKCMVVGTDGIRLCFGMEGVCISCRGIALMLRVDCDGVVGMLLCVVLLIEIGAVEVGLRFVVFDNVFVKLTFTFQVGVTAPATVSRLMFDIDVLCQVLTSICLKWAYFYVNLLSSSSLSYS